jgi:hypothetical protein
MPIHICRLPATQRRGSALLRSTLIVAMGMLAHIAHAAAPTELVGQWAVDVTKLPVPTPPRSVVLTLSDAGNGSLRMTFDTVGPDGAASHAEATFKTDGTPAKVQGSLDVDTVSVTLPNRRSMTMGAGMAGRPSNSRAFTLSDDGKRMTETIMSHGPDGVPRTRSNVWTRQ